METPSCLPFRACQKRQCLNVSIIHDLDGEKIENFTFTLVRNESLHKRINIDPVAGVVVIYYDDIGKLLNLVYNFKIKVGHGVLVHMLQSKKALLLEDYPPPPVGLFLGKHRSQSVRGVHCIRCMYVE